MSAAAPVNDTCVAHSTLPPLSPLILPSSSAPGGGVYTNVHPNILLFHRNEYMKSSLTQCTVAT